jgi:hypothetical protein
VTPKAAGSTFSMTSEAEHLVRLRKWFCALHDDVRGTFELTRLARAMSIQPSRQEALASWR